MYFEKQISGGRAFVEFARDGDRLSIARRGFISRYKSNGIQATPKQLATESPLIHDGSQNVTSTSFDARNSTQTGSTLNGPSGSGQFLAVYISTARTISQCSTTFQNLSSGNTSFYGILQNKPGVSQAADIGIFGVSKVVGGSTAIVGGTNLQTSSTSGGVLVPWVGGNGRACAVAIEACGTVGQVFTAFVLSGGGFGST